MHVDDIISELPIFILTIAILFPQSIEKHIESFDMMTSWKVFYTLVTTIVIGYVYCTFH